MSTCQPTRQQQSKRRAAKAGLQFVNEFDSGYGRRRHGTGFSYTGMNGQTLKGDRTRKRIESLVIPPAWEDVWICPSADGHIQARGRDEAGRLQYIYHPDWQTVSSAKKFDRMALFAEVLPRLRRRIRKDLNRDGLPRERVLAAIVRLLDKAHLRIGNEASEEARGATTLIPDDVTISDIHVSLEFPGKSGQLREVDFSDKKLAAIISECEEVDGQYLFSYQSEEGKVSPITSTIVNKYLQEVSGEHISAKDFRTWAGSTTALAVLAKVSGYDETKGRQTAARDAVKQASKTLGNTVAVCRESYVHPAILAAAGSGELWKMLAKLDLEKVAELTQDEIRFKELLPHLDFS